MNKRWKNKKLIIVVVVVLATIVLLAFLGNQWQQNRIQTEIDNLNNAMFIRWFGENCSNSNETLLAWQSNGMNSWYPVYIDSDTIDKVVDAAIDNGVSSEVENNIGLILNGGWSFDETQDNGLNMYTFLRAIDAIERTGELPLVYMSVVGGNPITPTNEIHPLFILCR
jgi:hypothetical protein